MSSSVTSAARQLRRGGAISLSVGLGLAILFVVLSAITSNWRFAMAAAAPCLLAICFGVVLLVRGLRS